MRGLARMVEDDRYCIDVITQIAAVRAALRGVEEEILKDHVAHCVEHAIASGNKAEQRRKVAELIEVLGRRARARSAPPDDPAHRCKRRGLGHAVQCDRRFDLSLRELAGAIVVT